MSCKISSLSDKYPGFKWELLFLSEQHILQNLIKYCVSKNRALHITLCATDGHERIKCVREVGVERLFFNIKSFCYKITNKNYTNIFIFSYLAGLHLNFY